MEEAANVGKGIFVTDDRSIPGEFNTQGVCHDNLKVCVAVCNPIDKVLKTFIHELTHRVIQMTYNNCMLPFDKSEDFTNMDKEIQLEFEYSDLQRLYSIHRSVNMNNSWLNNILKDYPKEEIAYELLPFFTEQIVSSILNNNLDKAVSSRFAHVVWKYLHKQLQTGLENEELPQAFYRIDTLTDAENELIKQAKEILNNDAMNHKLLDCEAGKLAFKALEGDEKNTYFTKLFKLPNEELGLVLNKHLVFLIESCKDCLFILTPFILGLPAEIINPIIKTHIGELFETPELRGQLCIMKYMLKMSGDEISGIIERNDISKFIKFCGHYADNILSKLSELSPANKSSLIAKYENNQLQISDEDFKTKIKVILGDTKVHEHTDLNEPVEHNVILSDQSATPFLGEHYDSNILQTIILYKIMCSHLVIYTQLENITGTSFE